MMYGREIGRDRTMSYAKMDLEMLEDIFKVMKEMEESAKKNFGICPKTNNRLYDIRNSMQKLSQEIHLRKN